jgi:hypothetical protein
MTFIQYLLPDGRQRVGSIDVSEETERLAAEIKAEGFRFESEILRTGKIHLDCCDNERSLWNIVRPNGPGMRDAVEELVIKAYREMQGRKVDVDLGK